GCHGVKDVGGSGGELMPGHSTIGAVKSGAGIADGPEAGKRKRTRGAAGRINPDHAFQVADDRADGMVGPMNPVSTVGDITLLTGGDKNSIAPRHAEQPVR